MPAARTLQKTQLSARDRFDELKIKQKEQRHAPADSSSQKK